MYTLIPIMNCSRQQKTAKNLQKFLRFFIKKWARSSSFHLRPSSNPSLRVKICISSSADGQFAITSNVCQASILSNSVLASTSGNEQQSPERSKTFCGFPSFAIPIHFHTFGVPKTKTFPEHKNTLK